MNTKPLQKHAFNQNITILIKQPKARMSMVMGSNLRLSLIDFKQKSNGDLTLYIQSGRRGEADCTLEECACLGVKNIG